MLTVRDLIKVSLGNLVAICFVLVCLVCFVSPLAGQPTGFRDLSSSERNRMTQQTQARVDKLTEFIKKDNRNVALYKERLQLYFDLLELNFDNNNWEIYADKFESDLSRIIDLEKTAEAFKERGYFLRERLRRSPPPKKITELYPRNRFIEQSSSDYLEAIKRTSDPLMVESIYTALGDLYALRPQKLVSAPDFQKWRVNVRMKLVLDDLDSAIKYTDKALEIGIKLPYADVLVRNSVEIYMRVANTAVQLGDYQSALEVYETGQTTLKKNSLISKNTQCLYYAKWGEVYLKLNSPDKAIEKFNVIFITNKDNYCAEIFGKRGDAYNIKGEFQKALSDYNRALSIDQSDSLMRKGWLYLKRAKLFLKMDKAEQALTDLTAAAEKKYIANCPQLYQIRAKVYRKLGKLELAWSDIKTANKLQNQANCSFE